MGRATMKARSRALLEVKGGYRMGRNDENAIGRAKARGGDATPPAAPRVALGQRRRRSLAHHVTLVRLIVDYRTT